MYFKSNIKQPKELKRYSQFVLVFIVTCWHFWSVGLLYPALYSQWLLRIVFEWSWRLCDLDTSAAESFKQWIKEYLITLGKKGEDGISGRCYTIIFGLTNTWMIIVVIESFYKGWFYKIGPDVWLIVEGKSLGIAWELLLINGPNWRMGYFLLQ